MDTVVEKIRREIALNRGGDRNFIMQKGFCEMVDRDEKVDRAYDTIRRGYPDSPTEEQCKGREFRESSGIILDALAEKTLKGIDTDKAVLMMPWRAGLAFGNAFSDGGVKHFYHISSMRDENTLETVVDFESGKAGKNNDVIIADPMLATGNTVLDSIRRMEARGVMQDRIVVSAVVAAPAGISMVKTAYPMVRIITGALDEKLDHRGYIVNGLGDFGDKFFFDISRRELDEIVRPFCLSECDYEILIRRMKKQGMN